MPVHHPHFQLVSRMQGKPVLTDKWVIKSATSQLANTPVKPQQHKRLAKTECNKLVQDTHTHTHTHFGLEFGNLTHLNWSNVSSMLFVR